MVVLLDLIRAPNFKPIRRCYIKRRFINPYGVAQYEPDWFLVSKIDGVNTVSKWGSFSISTEEIQDGSVGEFKVSTFSMEFKNDDGKFNYEDDRRSLWAGWLNRKFTKLRIETAYFDFDAGQEIGNTIIFEGLIDKITNNDNNKVTMQCIGYQDILQKISIKSLTGLPPVIFAAELVELMLTHEKCVEFIEPGDIQLGVNYRLHTQDLTLTFWHNLKIICKQSSSVPLIIGNKFHVLNSESGAELPFTFRGIGAAGPESIDTYSIKADQEGAEKVRVWWVVQDTNIEAKSTDPILLIKYLDSPETIDLGEVEESTDNYKQYIANKLLAKWQYPRPTVTLTTRYMNGLVWPLQKARINNPGNYTYKDNGFIWDGWLWNDGSVWNGVSGSIFISPNDQWLIEKATYDLDKWQTSIDFSKIRQPV
ncbi:hypothetical protein NO1_1816 [Candidatus Termititenax aidoneus]|uniref:Uncharacterized protein n=1 Tax=Termititenax aidoneus TaxID=2218524 RepID=A0A388TDC3_TERA1|nr:hypothetical protein NO1_1816 [Candidatus Termititenax aidoneus]